MTRLNEVLDVAAKIMEDRGTPNDGTFPPLNLRSRCIEVGLTADEFRAAVEEGIATGKLVEEPGQRLRLG